TLEIAGGLPRVQLPVFRAEQLTAPDAVEACGLDGIDPVLEWDAAAAGPDVAAALLDVAVVAVRVQRIAKIDAENVALVEPGDLLGSGAAVPKMIKVEHQADIVARRLCQQFELLIKAIERRERERF